MRSKLRERQGCLLSVPHLIAARGWWLTERKSCQLQTHGVVFEGEDEECSKDQDTPDGDIRQDPCRKAVGIDHGGTVPEDGHIGPGIRCRNDGYVDKARRRRVSEVERGKVEKVDDEQQFGQPEPASDPQHDKAEDQQIVLGRFC